MIENKKTVVELDEHRNLRGKHGGGSSGGGDMTNYVTKEEFNQTIKDLSYKMDLNQQQLLAKFDLVDANIKHNSESIKDKVQIAIDTKDKDDRKESIETRRYIIGTLLLGVASIIISLFN